MTEPTARAEPIVTSWMAKHSLSFLRVSLGVIYLWFGVLKFFPGVSPAEKLAVDTMEALTLGLFPSGSHAFVLAGWESLIGIGLLTGRFMRLTLILLGLQMLGTFMPLVLFPEVAFDSFPFVPSMEGHYIIKNLVLVGAAMALGATVRGGKVIADPVAASEARVKEQVRLHLVARDHPKAGNN